MRLSIVVVVNDDAPAHFSAISSAVTSARSILIFWVLVRNRTGQSSAIVFCVSANEKFPIFVNLYIQKFLSKNLYFKNLSLREMKWMRMLFLWNNHPLRLAVCKQGQSMQRIKMLRIFPLYHCM